MTNTALCHSMSTYSDIQSMFASVGDITMGTGFSPIEPMSTIHCVVTVTSTVNV